MRRALRLAALALVLLGGCKGPGPRPAPSQTMEKVFFFSERDEQGHEHAISARPPAGAQEDEALDEQPDQTVRSIADGATVDVNSKLRIDLGLSALGGRLDDAAMADLEASAKALTQALDGIAAFVEAEARASSAWVRYESLAEGLREGSPEQEAFIEARRARAELELDLLEPIRALWPRDSRELADERARAEELVERLESGEDPSAVVEDLNRLLQGRVAAWNRDANRLEREAEREIESRRLRIEAFLVPGDGRAAAHPIHVPGYDELDEGNLERIDPYGLDLSEAERERLTELMAASRELAATLERIRTGQADWKEAFQETRSAILQRFDRLARLAAQLESDALQARVQATREHLEALLATLQQRLPQVAEAHAATWREELERTLQATEELAAVAEQARQLADLARRWRELDPADLDALIVDSAAAARRLGDLLDADELEARLDAVRAALEAVAREQLGELAADVRDEVLEAARPLVEDLDGWRKLALELRSALEALARFLGLGGSPPVELELTSPASFSVPLDTAPDTTIDLKATRRRAGDRLRVRARVVDAEDHDVLQPLDTTFDLEKLGWHADYVPAVVYVTADEVAGATDRGGFSASLAWQWSYGARDDEDDPYLSRALGWSAGLHAALLAFAPDNDPEIGLGVTLGLWQNRILLGAGYNLFADSRDDGRYYYYIGSSLIPLLQALQGSDDGPSQ